MCLRLEELFLSFFRLIQCLQLVVEAFIAVFQSTVQLIQLMSLKFKERILQFLVLQLALNSIIHLFAPF